MVREGQNICGVGVGGRGRCLGRGGVACLRARRMVHDGQQGGATAAAAAAQRTHLWDGASGQHLALGAVVRLPRQVAQRPLRRREVCVCVGGGRGGTRSAPGVGSAAGGWPAVARYAGLHAHLAVLDAGCKGGNVLLLRQHLPATTLARKGKGAGGAEGSTRQLCAPECIVLVDQARLALRRVLAPPPSTHPHAPHTRLT